MSEITINNSPVHSPVSIIRPYGYVLASYTCGWHTGVDLVPYGSTPTNPPIFPVKAGTVVYVLNSTSDALGVQVQIRDDDGRYWRYCHMVLNSITVGVGDRVTTDTQIGIMGTTGNSTRNSFTFRIFYYTKLAMLYIFKSLHSTWNSKRNRYYNKL